MIHVIQEHPDEDDSAAREERQHISAMWRETWCMQDSREGSFIEDSHSEVAPEATEDVSAKQNEESNSIIERHLNQNKTFHLSLHYTTHCVRHLSR